LPTTTGLPWPKYAYGTSKSNLSIKSKIFFITTEIASHTGKNTNFLPLLHINQFINTDKAQDSYFREWEDWLCH